MQKSKTVKVFICEDLCHAIVGEEEFVKSGMDCCDTSYEIHDVPMNVVLALINKGINQQKEKSNEDTTK